MDTVTSVGIGDAKSPVVIGVQFDYAGRDRREIVQEWVNGIRIEPPVPDCKLLEISMECGGHALYRTADDIPLVDVPCPCGDPNHWLVKWTDSEVTT